MPAEVTRRGQLEELSAQLDTAEEMLRAMRAAEIDTERPYRNLVEGMQEGAAILTTHGAIIYCNRRFAELVSVPLHEVPLHEVIGGPVLLARSRLLVPHRIQFGTSRPRTTDTHGVYEPTDQDHGMVGQGEPAFRQAI